MTFKDSDLFNPFINNCVVMLPNWLLCRTEISAESKVIYAVLMSIANDEGKSSADLSLISNNSGTNENLCEKALKDLEKFKLIHPIIHNVTKMNYYMFLQHEWMNDSLEPKILERINKEIKKENNYV